MEERETKLLLDKEKNEDKIKKIQGKLKLINQELKNIELQRKSESTDKIIELLKGKGISDVSQFIELIKDGKVNINNGSSN
ncbi:hypothetical protein [Clostridium estertheticum]|uniref:hypothetical protein n=1 Tax=Clostridium estertheticum TaxID=238834 RepID=UPI001C7DBCF7|nr:hypothetical protein [Clostridium estertheticum]MBX4267195.1 hypothetical protein [Clostridium estertheticum]MBX4272061.1 hypothetical protein [Clostridium estertheticum]WLC82443.1 hypothetical protein KTC98_23995 [Clostridium estertheticum]WLC91317.1 hypothetical protein KTC95_23965 [Clostridium estertheticum]